MHQDLFSSFSSHNFPLEVFFILIYHYSYIFPNSQIFSPLQSQNFPFKIVDLENNIIIINTILIVWKVVQGTSFGKTKLSKVWSVSFDIKPLGVVHGSSNVMLITADDKNCCKFGNRMPGVWFVSKSTKLLICAGIGNKWNYCYHSRALPLNKFSSVSIVQNKKNGKYIYEITINGKRVRSVVNKRPQVFENMQIWAGDLWYKASNSMLRNFEITNLGKRSILQLTTPPAKVQGAKYLKVAVEISIIHLCFH